MPNETKNAMHALNLMEAFCWALLAGVKEGETEGWIKIDGWIDTDGWIETDGWVETDG